MVDVVKVKLLAKNARVPERKTQGAAGWDLTCSQDVVINGPDPINVHTGVSIEIPDDMVAKLYLRSSLTKRGLSIPHGVGIIDSDYRGELFVPIQISNWDYKYKKPRILIEEGERIGQLLFEILPQVRLVVVDQLSQTERGDGGFGSTGK